METAVPCLCMSYGVHTVFSGHINSIYDIYIYIYIIYIYIYIYIFIYIYEVRTISFQTFFVWAFKIFVDSWNSLCDCYTSYEMTDQVQMNSYSTNWNTPYNSWWISQMQSGSEDTLEERYAIKFCFKLGKNATETYGMFQTSFGASCMNRASVFEWHNRFKKPGCLWGMMRGVGGVRKSIHHSWLAKGLGLGLLCWGF